MIAISYRREDSLPIAGRLYDRLQAEFGKRNVFMDFDSIPPGVDFRERIKETIEKSDLVIALIGPQWLGEQSNGSRRIDDPTDFVRLEIEYALKGGIPLIPLLINSTPMPKPEKLPSDIRALAFRNALPLDSGMDFHSHTDRVISGITNFLKTAGVGTQQERSKSSALPGWQIAYFGAVAVVALAISMTYYFVSDRSKALHGGPGFSLTGKPDERVAAFYTGTIRVQNDPNSPLRQIAVALNSDHRSGTMTQSSKRGDLVVKFTGVWDGNEFRAVTGDVMSEPSGVQWTPESFTLRFAEGGKTAGYESTTDEKTYVADLVASTAPQRNTQPNADSESESVPSTTRLPEKPWEKPHIYLHIADESQRELALKLKEKLVSSGNIVVEIQNVSGNESIPMDSSELRFFTPGDEAEAQAIAKEIAPFFGDRGIFADLPEGMPYVSHARQYEIWFSSTFH